MKKIFDINLEIKYEKLNADLDPASSFKCLGHTAEVFSCQWIQPAIKYNNIVTSKSPSDAGLCDHYIDLNNCRINNIFGDKL